MIKNICESEFIKLFKDYNRENNFSVEGRRALFNYLEQMEEETGENQEVDIISFCCEYSEFKNLNEYLNNYNTDINKEDFEEENEFNAEDYEKAVFEEIQNKTTLIKFGEDEEGFIIQQY